MLKEDVKLFLVFLPEGIWEFLGLDLIILNREVIEPRFSLLVNRQVQRLGRLKPSPKLEVFVGLIVLGQPEWLLFQFGRIVPH